LPNLNSAWERLYYSFLLAFLLWKTRRRVLNLHVDKGRLIFSYCFCVEKYINY